MNQSNFPDLIHCRKIAHLFPESEWWWNFRMSSRNYDLLLDRKQDLGGQVEPIPAPTIAEMLERLPNRIDTDMHRQLIIYKEAKNFHVHYIPVYRWPKKAGKEAWKFYDISLANALASILEYLDKNKILEEKK